MQPGRTPDLVVELVVITDTYRGIILAHIGMGVSFGAFWMRIAFRAAPKSIADTAAIDGANSWTQLWKVSCRWPVRPSSPWSCFTWTWKRLLPGTDPGLRPGPPTAHTWPRRILRPVPPTDQLPGGGDPHLATSGHAVPGIPTAVHPGHALRRGKGVTNGSSPSSSPSPTCPSPRTRPCGALRRAGRCRCERSGPLSARARSTPSAARCGRCPVCPSTRAPNGSTSTRRATSSVCPESSGNASPGPDLVADVCLRRFSILRRRTSFVCRW
jgi:hypothetical protein